MENVFENFESLSSFLGELKTRSQNPSMAGCNSSRTGSQSFTGSKSMEEAMELLRTGYKDPLEKIKQGFRDKKNLISKFTDISKSRPHNSVIGYLPNVPNAILNLPESMINSDKIPTKHKTIGILYCESGSAGEDTDFFINSGICLVTAINILELMGIQTKLMCGCFTAQHSDQFISGSVTIKHYGQRLDLLKVCFPLIHPSMFRRIGFKYLETCKYPIYEGFNSGYGRPVSSAKTLKEKFQKYLNPQDCILTTTTIRDLDYDVEKLLNYIQNKKD